IARARDRQAWSAPELPRMERSGFRPRTTAWQPAYTDAPSILFAWRHLSFFASKSESYIDAICSWLGKSICYRAADNSVDQDIAVVREVFDEEADVQTAVIYIVEGQASIQLFIRPWRT